MRPHTTYKYISSLSPNYFFASLSNHSRNQKKDYLFRAKNANLEKERRHSCIRYNGEGANQRGDLFSLNMCINSKYGKGTSGLLSYDVMYRVYYTYNHDYDAKIYPKRTSNIQQKTTAYEFNIQTQCCIVYVLLCTMYTWI